MAIKNQKKVSITYMIIGAVIFLIFTLTEDMNYKSGILCGFGTALFVAGLIRMVRLRRLTKDPEKAADYEAACKDERVIYIANKARSLTFAISLYTQLAVGLIAIFAFDQQLLGKVLCYLVCFQCLLFTLVYRIYSKKY